MRDRVSVLSPAIWASLQLCQVLESDKGNAMCIPELGYKRHVASIVHRNTNPFHRMSGHLTAVCQRAHGQTVWWAVPGEVQPSTTLSPQLSWILKWEAIREWILRFHLPALRHLRQPQAMCQTFWRGGKPSSLVLFYSTKFWVVCYAAIVTGTGHQQEGAGTGLRNELTQRTQCYSTDQAEGSTNAKNT